MDKNDYYKGFRYEGNKKIEEQLVKHPINHKSFETIGVYNFGELDLGKYGWTRIHPLDNHSEVVASINKEGIQKKKENPIKILIYKGEPGTAVMELNLKENYHQMYIFISKYSDNNSKIIEETKQMFERELKCRWYEQGDMDKKEPVSGLIKKLESN